MNSQWPRVTSDDLRAFVGLIAVIVILAAILIGMTAVET